MDYDVHTNLDQIGEGPKKASVKSTSTKNKQAYIKINWRRQKRFFRGVASGGSRPTTVRHRRNRMYVYMYVQFHCLFW